MAAVPDQVWDPLRIYFKTTTMPDSQLRHCFSDHYEQAREKFIAAALNAGSRMEHHVLPSHSGSQDETLSTDTALLGEADFPSLVVITSGVHGVEGFCGSGCQVAMLHDHDLLQRARDLRIALLFIHAVNPHGFSHIRRANEHNVDINRNFLDFADHRPSNPRYADVHDLLLPAQWPPTPQNRLAIERYVAQHGQRAFRRAATAGQSEFPDGMFYAGAEPSWSNKTLRQLIRTHGSGKKKIAWIDLHTGLGPYGHGEKIHAGLHTQENLSLTRSCWGPDVVAAWDGQSASEQVRGPAVGCAFEECPNAEIAGIALEFGTVPYDVFLDAVRGDHWLNFHMNTDPELREKIRRDTLNAFYIDHDEWRGMVTAQSRLAVLQACMALGR